MDTGGAIPMKNDKGEITMKKVKVKRYVAGKRPDYAEMSDEDIDEESNQRENTRTQIAQAVSNKLNSKKPDEMEDRRLRRLKDREKMNSNENHERITRHRQILEPEVLVDEEDIPDQDSSEDDEEDDEKSKELNDDVDDEMDLDDENSDNENQHTGVASRRHIVSDGENNDEVDEDERIRHRQLLRQRALERKQEEELLGVGEEDKKLGESSESEEEESEYEDEEYSEEEEEVAPRLKPVFVRKRDRVTIKEKEMEEEKQKEIENEQNRLREDAKKQAKKAIEEELRKERLREKEAEENITCDFDTEEENDDDYESWKLRELRRIKRDREEKESRENEKEEILRLRKMTEEERLAELKARPKQIVNQAEKGKYKYLQKYFHRGAYFMHEEQDVFKRNFAEPTLEDHFDKTILPKVMQVKNFGMAGRTKYTHLVDQDTSKLDENPWNVEAGNVKQVFDRPTTKKKKSN